MPRISGPILLLLASCLARGAQAQLPSTLSDEARVSLVTVTQGDAVYALFGHSALRIRDPQTGLDIVLNYGTFDFSEPYFIPRFVYGILKYRLSVSSTRSLLLGSEVEQRGVVDREIALSPDQRRALYARLLVNLRPENSTYRYDFFFDNCSTRIRDIVEPVAKVTWTADETGGRTLRELLRPWTAHRPWLGTGIDLLLGSVTDRAATPREGDFLPLMLDASFLEATVDDDSGRALPLVVASDTLSWYPERASVPSSMPWPTLLGWLALAAGTAVTWRRRAARRGPTVPDRWFFGLLGGVGVILTFLSFFSEHAAMAGNLNVLWAAPSHLLIAFWARRLPQGLVRLYLGLAAAAAVLALTGGLLLPQAPPTALLPVVGLLALRAWTGMRSLG